MSGAIRYDVFPSYSGKNGPAVREQMLWVVSALSTRAFTMAPYAEMVCIGCPLSLDG